MKLIGLPVLVLSALVSVATQAEIKAVTDDGRAVTLFEDNTWQYADPVAAVDKAADAEAEEEPSPLNGTLVMTLEKLVDTGSSCTFGMRLQNNSPYRVADLVPHYSAYTVDEALFDTEYVSFRNIKPTLSYYNEGTIMGLGCSAISYIKMHGGDRCKYHELDRWNSNDGECLALIKLESTDRIKIVQQYKDPEDPQE